MSDSAPSGLAVARCRGSSTSPDCGASSTPIPGGGIAALLWIGTGLVRAFGGFEKGSFYYLHNHVFWAKMVLLVAILVLELGPMIALIRWRGAVARGAVPDTRAASRFARISFVQGILVVLMVLAATAMARGYGVPAR